MSQSNHGPAALDYDLGETADMLRDQVRSFAAREIAPRAAAIDRENEFPADLWRKMGDLGVLGITVEEEYGGRGWGTWSMSWRWRKSRGLRPRWGCPMGRIPISA